jgi:hypothetical protein
MLKLTNLDEKKAEAQKLLAKIRSAVNQPRLYVYQFFEDMRNDIDVQSYTILNETNMERIYERQAKLIDKVQEFESLCLEQVNLDIATDFQVTIEQAESNLNRPVVSQAELDRVIGHLSNVLFNVEKVLFQDKCVLFVKAGEIKDETGSFTNITDYFVIEQNNLFGLFIFFEDLFIRKEAFNQK